MESNTAEKTRGRETVNALPLYTTLSPLYSDPKSPVYADLGITL